MKNKFFTDKFLLGAQIYGLLETWRIIMGILAGFMTPHPPLIIPDVGRGEEKKIQKTIDAYQKVAEAIGRLQPETIVLLSPHQTLYADYFHISPGEGARGDFGQFRAGQVSMKVAYDTEFVRALCEAADAVGLPAGTLGERERKLDHGTMVPLYFVNQYWTGYRLVRVGLSGLPLSAHYRLGQCIRETAQTLERKMVLIASGDLSHKLKEDGPYGYQEEGPSYDTRIMDVMGRGAFGELLDFKEDFCEKAAECGHRSFTILAGAFDRTAVEAKQLSYEGPFGVGYGVCAFEPRGNDGTRNFLDQYEEKERKRLLALREQEDPYVRLARYTIEAFTETGKLPEMPSGLPEELYSSRAGAFVSLKEDGNLRGCIGTTQAVRSSLGEEIMYNAVSACSEDPRFPPVEDWEVERLTISVDVLGKTEKISSPEELDTVRYGVIVTKGARRGLLLPNLEGVDTVRQQISIAKQKAGIKDHESVELERFEVIRHY